MRRGETEIPRLSFDRDLRKRLRIDALAFKRSRSFGVIVILAGGSVRADVAGRESADTTDDTKPPHEADGRSADQLSAFYELDDRLPPAAPTP